MFENLFNKVTKSVEVPDEGWKTILIAATVRVHNELRRKFICTRCQSVATMVNIVNYNPAADILHINYATTPVTRATQFSSNVILEYSEGNPLPVGIRLLQYRGHLGFLQKLEEQKEYTRQEILKEFPGVTVVVAKDLDSNHILTIHIYNLPNDGREKWLNLAHRLYREFHVECNASVSFFDYTIEQTNQYYPEYAKKELN